MNLKCDICDKLFLNKRGCSNHKRWHSLPKYENFQKLFIKKIKKAWEFIDRKCYQGMNLKEKNGMWKGKNVKYGSLHDYVKYHFPKTKLCQRCGLKPAYDLANISGKYKRILKDWEWLCRKCHMEKDGRMAVLIKRNRINPPACKKTGEKIF